jgi:deoxyribodipyrimidine photolyase-related protein
MPFTFYNYFSLNLIKNKQSVSINVSLWKTLFIIKKLPVINAAAIIFPHQLFKQHPAVSHDKKIFIVEEWLFFHQYKFIKQKLVLHRASMQFYKSYLQKQSLQVEYFAATDPKCDIRLLIPFLAEQGINEIHFADVTDDWLEKRITKTSALHNVNTIKYATPGFLNQLSEVEDFFNLKKTYFQTDFYIWQRKKRKILLTADGKAEGGKWSFDHQNRKKFAKGERIPAINFPQENEFVKEARAYIDAHFKENYGTTDSHITSQNVFFPVTYEEAENWLEQFLLVRLPKFGVYEDAMLGNESFLYHSALTPMLNIGLLDPHQIIDKAIAVATQENIPLNSLEGFIRQIIGWREYIRIVYQREGSRQRTKNHWGFTRKIPESFWTGKTGIAPVDKVISRVLKIGYSHHIERLMVMGNFMLLCEFDPDEVYRWFMEMYVDAYDWVMVPNTYGMTQFADGGLMMTKPYISGSNYIMKMSDYKKGDWQLTWDGLFWRFMHVHRDFIGKNKRLAILIASFNKMPAEKKQILLNAAEDFLKKLDSGNLYDESLLF